MHPRVLKEIEEVVLHPLKVIFEKLLASGILPRDWKSGVVTAIYKKGKKTDVGNYRPVTLTSIPCKVMESMIRDHLVDHLIKNKYERYYRPGRWRHLVKI